MDWLTNIVISILRIIAAAATGQDALNRSTPSPAPQLPGSSWLR